MGGKYLFPAQLCFALVPVSLSSTIFTSMSFQTSGPRVAGQDSDIVDIFFPSDVSQCLLDVGLSSMPGKQMYGNSEAIKSWIDTIHHVSLVDSPALSQLIVSCRRTNLSTSWTIPMVLTSSNSLPILSDLFARVLCSPTSLNWRAMPHFPSMHQRGLQK